MPPKQRDLEVLDLPEWVERLAHSDPCLYEIVAEALIARSNALKLGASRGRRTRGLVESGDKTIWQIGSGRYQSSVACQKASVALRHYTMAYDRLSLKYGKIE